MFLVSPFSLRLAKGTLARGARKEHVIAVALLNGGYFVKDLLQLDLTDNHCVTVGVLLHSWLQRRLCGQLPRIFLRYSWYKLWLITSDLY